MTRRFTPEVLELIAHRFKVLADPTRLKILGALRAGEKTVTQLVAELGTGQANLSKHLNLLYRNRMVSRRKEGLHVFYAIGDVGIFDLCGRMCEAPGAGEDPMRAAG